jgi:hypothetical protein
MQNLWNKIQAWFVAQGGLIHGLVVIYLTLVGLYATVPAFASLLNSLYASTPSFIHEVVLAALGVLAFYAKESPVVTQVKSVNTAPVLEKDSMKEGL